MSSKAAAAQLWLALVLVAAIAEARPNPTRLKNAMLRHDAALVEVVGPKKRGPGVIVSSDGLVATSVDYVSLYDAKVKIGGEERVAQVVFADAALKIAVVRLPGEGPFPAAPVKATEAWKRGAWMLGMVREGAGSKGKEGPLLSLPSKKSPFLEVGFPLPAGAPVIDEAGELVAISVGKRGAYSSRALPVARIREGLKAAASR